MKSAIRAVGGVWPHVLTQYDYDKSVDPPGGICTWNEKVEAPDVPHHLSLYFFAAPSAASAQTELHRRLLVGILAKPAFPRTGADEAYAKEHPGKQATTTTAAWRKGRYWGQMMVAGPGLSGDLDDARDFLKQLMIRLPST